MRRTVYIVSVILSAFCGRLFGGVDREIAVVTGVRGMVMAGYNKFGSDALVSRGHLLMNRAVVRTGMKGTARIRFVNSGTTVLVRPETEIVFSVVGEGDRASEVVQINAGQAICDVAVSAEGSFDINTPATVVTAQSCVVLVTHDEKTKNSAVFCASGSCRVSDPDFSRWTELAASSVAYVTGGSPFIYMSTLAAGDNSRLDEFVAAARSLKLRGPVTHSLIVKSDSGGTVVPANSMTALEGYGVEIAAVPASGFAFVRWDVLHGAAIIANPAAESTMVSVATDALIAARFTDTPSKIAIGTKGEGSTAPAGATVVPRKQLWKITALPKFGYMLTKWQVSKGVKIIARDSVSASFIADIPEGTITADFVRRTYTCAVNAGKGGTVKPNKKVRIAGGDSIPVNAVANKGYTFIRWDVVNGKAVAVNPYAATTVIRCDSLDAGVRAVFNKTGRTAMVVVGNHERASVLPFGKVAVPLGDSLILEAAPAAGYRVESWTIRTGSADIKGLEHVVVRPREGCELVPVVTTKVYHATLGSSGPGSTEPSGISRVFHGTPFTVTAIPQPGKQFAVWRILGGNAVITDKNAAKTTVTLSSTDAVLAAEFADAVYKLTVNTTDGGYTEPAGVQIMYEGKTIGLKAVPNPQAAFLGWSIESGGKNLEFSDTLTVREQMVTMKEKGSAVCTARFSTETVELMVTGNGLGTTEPPKTAWVPKNLWIPIRAVPAERNVFVQWVTGAGGQPAVRDPFSAETEVNSGTQNVSVKAVFAPSAEAGVQDAPSDLQTANNGPVILTISADGHLGSVEPEGPLKLQPGTAVTLTATAAPQYYFAGWVLSEGTAVIADRSNRKTSVTLMQKNAVVEARFVQRVLQTIETEFTDPAGLKKSIIIQYR